MSRIGNGIFISTVSYYAVEVKVFESYKIKKKSFCLQVKDNELPWLSWISTGSDNFQIQSLIRGYFNIALCRVNLDVKQMNMCKIHVILICL
jgi:hypothetical protein